MVVLNFTIPHLKPRILNGTKQHSIRRNSEYWNRVLKSGAMLNLYFNQRSPNREHLFDAPFLDRDELYLEDITEGIAIADGFDSLKQCQLWLTSTYKNEWQNWFLLIWWDYNHRRMPPTFARQDLLDKYNQARGLQ